MRSFIKVAVAQHEITLLRYRFNYEDGNKIRTVFRFDSKDMDTSEHWDVKSGVTINTKKNDDDAIQITIIHIYLFAVILLHL